MSVKVFEVYAKEASLKMKRYQDGGAEFVFEEEDDTESVSLTVLHILSLVDAIKRVQTVKRHIDSIDQFRFTHDVVSYKYPFGGGLKVELPTDDHDEFILDDDQMDEVKTFIERSNDVINRHFDD